MSAVFARRMIRRYTAQPVARAEIELLIEAATQAPSPHNRQPWRFAVLTGEARTRLAQAMGEQLRADLARDGLSTEAIERDATRSQLRIMGAPAGILMCLSMRDMDVYPDAARALAERWMAGQAVACATQNLLLAASAAGLGACWMCAPLFCPVIVSKTLDLPADWEPQALITLGHPADAGRERPRRPVSDLSLWLDL